MTSGGPRAGLSPRILRWVLALFIVLTVVAIGGKAFAESAIGGANGGSSSATASGTVNVGFLITGPAVSGSVTGLSISMSGTTTGQTETIGLYAVSAGLPTTRLTSCSGSIGATTGAKFLACVPSPALTLAPRTTYGVAIEGNGADGYFAVGTSTTPDWYCAGGPTYTGQTGLPTTLVGVTIASGTACPNMVISYTDNYAEPSVAVNNFPTPQATVAVNNFPATQPVSGTVGVNNFPATQAVSGTVGVSNFPATQAVSGTVGVSNFPASQSVAVSNWPTLQHVSVDNTRILIGIDSSYANSSLAVSNFPTPQATVAVNNFPTPLSTFAVSNPQSAVSVISLPAVNVKPATSTSPFPVTISGGSSGSGSGGDAATLTSPASYNPGDTGNWSDVGPWFAVVMLSLVLVPFSWLTLTAAIRRIIAGRL